MSRVGQVAITLTLLPTRRRHFTNTPTTANSALLTRSNAQVPHRALGGGKELRIRLTADKVAAACSYFLFLFTDLFCFHKMGVQNSSVEA